MRDVESVRRRRCRRLLEIWAAERPARKLRWPAASWTCALWPGAYNRLECPTVHQHEEDAVRARARGSGGVVDPRPFCRVNRHFDLDNRPHERPLTKPASERVPDGVTRSVDVQALVTLLTRAAGRRGVQSLTKPHDRPNVPPPRKQIDLTPVSKISPRLWSNREDSGGRQRTESERQVATA